MADWISVFDAWQSLKQDCSKLELPLNPDELLIAIKDGQIVADCRHPVTGTIDKLPIGGWDSNSGAEPRALLSHLEIQENKFEQWSDLVGMVPILDSREFRAWKSARMEEKSLEDRRQAKLDSKHDPLSESIWTLPMVLAWLIFGSVAMVRIQMNGHRSDDWGGGEATVRELAFTYGTEVADGSSQLMSFDNAYQELWAKLMAGELVADAMGINGRPTSIPSSDWKFLQPDYSQSNVDQLVYENETDAAYQKVKFDRDQVLAIWASPTAKGEFILNRNPHGAGRPTKGDWEVYIEEVVTRCKLDGPPEKHNVDGWRTKADVEHFIRKLHVEKDGNDECATSTYRKYATKALERCEKSGTAPD